MPIILRSGCKKKPRPEGRGIQYSLISQREQKVVGRQVAGYDLLLTAYCLLLNDLISPIVAMALANLVSINGAASGTDE